ncbi:SH3 domain-containing protein [Herpetosiphon giganteus]|uniref:SH3 domain-containing protein n=1 Tax=Herpetosiphon giganteus TaxID=2029754 RepID=UPI0019571429|nr:SH3 domain-containing protein [Herpetosiphon giganteus]MBM7846277.1 hypothetical protein [Herpetosiphon giganteus]
MNRMQKFILKTATILFFALLMFFAIWSADQELRKKVFDFIDNKNAVPTVIIYQVSPDIIVNTAKLENTIIISGQYVKGYYICSRYPYKQSCDGKGYLNLRSYPCSLDKNVIKELKSGQYVVPTGPIVAANCDGRNDAVPEWIPVKTEDGKEGYISASPKYSVADVIEIIPTVTTPIPTHYAP